MFAARPLSVNPVALVPDADGLGDDRVHAIARDVSQSETTFLLEPSVPGASWRLRGTLQLSSGRHQGADALNAGDETHLRRAQELAVEARRAGGPPYGSLLVGADGSVLAEERNTVLTSADVTAHPELKLARWAARYLDEATARTTTTM